jgi:hypothetical protein
LKLNATAIDLLVSKQWKIFEPYAGISTQLNHGKETTSKVELTSENSMTPRLMIGTQLKYKFATASVEYDVSTLNTLAFKVGATF